MEKCLFDEMKTLTRETMAISIGIIKAGRSGGQEIPNVKTIRDSIGVSQTEFAKAIGVSAETVSDWELNIRVPARAASMALRMISEDPEMYIRFQEV